MANQSTFPTTLDGTPTDRSSADAVPSADWNKYFDGIDQLEQKVGVDSSAVSGSLDYKVSATRLINLIYPVGSIYTSVASANPGTLFGIGTWVAFGAGRVPVGIDAVQTEFDTVEEIGGEKTHTLTVNEMPAHTHPNARGDLNSSSGTALSPPGDTIGATGSTGGGAAHNNLQPYIVVYMWKRTV